jgi:hypothetical protein
VILGEDLWRTRYLSDSRILGSTIRVDGVPSTIIGVMPQGFGFLFERKSGYRSSGSRKRHERRGVTVYWKASVASDGA